MLNDPMAGGGGMPGGGAAGGVPGTGGGTPPPEAGAGGEGNQNISTQAMVDQIVKMQAPDASQMNEQQMNEMRREARDFIMDTREALEEVFPDATRGQSLAFAEAMLKVDPAAIIKAVQDAMRVSQEKEDNDNRTTGQDLHVQTGGAGSREGGNKAPRSMGEAVVNAASLFRR